MKKKVIVYGKNGQVGRALCALLGEKAIGFSHKEKDFSKINILQKTLDKIEISAFINAAAYTDVNMAEMDDENAIKGNTTLPKTIAEYCNSRKIPFVHYSTDYVFGDDTNKPHKEDDITNPLNIYGQTKLDGENAIIEVGGQYLIFRTSWVYDETGRNFLTTMLKLGKEREDLHVIVDQIGAPTYAPHLAKATLQALSNKDFTPGIYHLCGRGQTSWHGFAGKIFSLAHEAGIPLKVKNLKPINSIDYKTPAIRPKNSALNCTKAKELLHITMPHWEKGVEECIKNLSLTQKERQNA